MLRVLHVLVSDLDSRYASTYLGTIDFEKFRAMSDVVCVIAPIS